MKQAAPARSRLDYVWVIAILVVSRGLFHWLGVRFDTSTFPAYLQFMDPELLADRLLESLWYYHATPPLLNLFVGTVTKLFGGSSGVVYAVCFHLLGVVFACSLFALVRRLTGMRIAAFITTTLFVFSPSFVLYENWLMYTFPTAALVAAAGWALMVYLDGGRPAGAFLFFSLLATIALTRSLFHLGWLVAMVVFLVAALPGRRRQVSVAALGPLLIVIGWYLKNAILFGTFSASTMLGLGLTNITTLTVPREGLRPLVEEGVLSPLSVVSRYYQKDELLHYYDAQPTGIPVLDQVHKSSGQYNYNYRPMIQVNRQLTRDAMTTVRHFPSNYVVAWVIANSLFYSPTHMNLYFSRENRAAIRPLERFFNPVLHGARIQHQHLIQPHFGYDRPASLEVNPGVPLILAWWAVLYYGVIRVRRDLFAASPSTRNRALLVAFAVFNLVYVSGVATCLELAENYRYRFLVEGLFLVLATLALVDGGRKLAARAGWNRRLVA